MSSASFRDQCTAPESASQRNASVGPDLADVPARDKTKRSSGLNETEMIGWGQRMEDALEKLRAPDAKSGVQDGDEPARATKPTSVAAEKNG